MHLRTYRCYDHLLSYSYIGCATDNVQRNTLAHIDKDDVELISIGMLFTSHYLTDDQSL